MAGAPKVSKMMQMWQLLAQGYAKNSLEVKALGIKSSTRENYASKYIKLGSPTLEQLRKGNYTSRSTGPITPTSLPGGESISGFNESTFKPKIDTPESDNEQENNQDTDDEFIPDLDDDGISQEILGGDSDIDIRDEDSIEIDGQKETEKPAKPSQERIEVRKNGDDNKPDNNGSGPSIVSEGLTVTVNLSLKTLMLYQVAANLQKTQDPEVELMLGDFVDVCVEDVYKGRGYDLGLVRSNGGKKQ